MTKDKGQKEKNLIRKYMYLLSIILAVERSPPVTFYIPSLL
ncbi:hypothetical protein [Nostoc sp.]